MKVKCQKCQKNIAIVADSQISQYSIGKIECPYCHTKQRRYISEADLLEYLCVSCLVYSVIIYIITRCLVDLFTIRNILIFAGIFTIMFFLQKQVSEYIYLKPFFKKETMNDQKVYEEAKTIKRKMRILFYLFLVLDLMIGTVSKSNLLYVLATIGYLIILFVYTYFVIKKEKSVK